MKDTERLKALLNIRVNEQKMLNNTLCDLLTKNSSKEVLESIREEICTVEADIANISNELDKLEEKDVTYSYYDKGLDETNPITSNIDNMMKRDIALEKERFLYDTITKQQKAAEFIENENSKGNLYDGITKKMKCDRSEPKKCESSQNGIMAEFRSKVASTLNSNKFLVHIGNGLSIPEVMVKSVSFAPSINTVYLCIYDFITTKSGQEMPIMRVLDGLKGVYRFNFSIEHLDASLKSIYVEEYDDCFIKSIDRDSLDYSEDSSSTIQICISYGTVTYETSK